MARKKKSRGRKRRKKPNLAILLMPLLAVAVALLLWLANAGFEDRHWQGYRMAGQRAFDRGNYEYALRMHKKALKVAEELDPDHQHVAESLRDISKTRAVLGKQKESALKKARPLP